MVVVVEEEEEEEEEKEEGGRRRAEGRPPPEPRREGGSVQKRGRGGDEKFPKKESGAGVYICSTEFAREAIEASKINIEQRGGRRSRF